MMYKPNNNVYDFLIIGGGFYGCCLALHLSKYSKKVVIIEKEKDIFNRSSKVNQARVHTGFHYPRSALTAVKSLVLHSKFKKEFSEAIFDDFDMLYAISKYNSKVGAKRFYKMFKEMGSPITEANQNNKALFNNDYIENVFECKEYAFDFSILKNKLKNILEMEGVDLFFQKKVSKILDSDNPIVYLEDSDPIEAKYVFNVTYGNINNLLDNSKLQPIELKNELVELAFIKPPNELKNLAITVMDGPFFSIMPFPSLGLYSFSHVRYSVHKTWFYDQKEKLPYDELSSIGNKSNYIYMLKDAVKYLPSLKNSKYEKSLFEFKSILIKNEHNDGRPIVYYKSGEKSNICSILGGKLDNIYDLYNLIDNETFFID